MTTESKSSRSHMIEDSEGRRPIPDPTILTTQQLYREIETLRESFNGKIEFLVQKLDISESTIDSRIISSEAHRTESLKLASVAIQTGLDKTEKQLQTSLDRIQQDQRLAVTEVEKRIEEKFVAKDKSMDEKVHHLRSLNDEKFGSISLQFAERDTRTEQISSANKLAIDAALQAAKEAVGEQNKSNLLANAKSEAAFTKQIDQIGMLIQSMTTGVNDKIDDIKDRITLIEGRMEKAEGNRSGIKEQVIDSGTKVNHTTLVAMAAIAFLALVVSAATLFVSRIPS